MKKLIFLVLLLCFMCPNSFGFYKVLNDSLIQEAINYGEKNKKKSSADFAKPWAIYRWKNSGSGAIAILIVTKWLFISSEACDKAQRYQSFTVTEARTSLKYKFLPGDIMFCLQVYGNEIDFAEDIYSVVKIDTVVIHPAQRVYPGIAELSASWPYSPKYTAVCRHFYRGIPSNAQIEFIIIDTEGKETSYKKDLSKIK